MLRRSAGQKRPPIFDLAVRGPYFVDVTGFTEILSGTGVGVGACPGPGAPKTECRGDATRRGTIPMQ